MGYEVVFLGPAEEDLRNLKVYIVKNFGRRKWALSYAEVKKSVDILKTFPLQGNVPDEFEVLYLQQFRQILSGINRVIYEIRDNGIYIHAIVDVRRDMRSLLTSRLLRAT